MISSKYIQSVFSVALFFLMAGCSDGILEENPTSFLNESNVFQRKAGFEAALTGMYKHLRDEINAVDNPRTNAAMHLGTDIATAGEPALNAYHNYITTQTPQFNGVNAYWDWAYLKSIPAANIIIQNADRGDWRDEAEKNAIIAEAHFGRAYVYNVLANLYGGVPIVDVVPEEPRFDYQRASRLEVLDFVREDLEFAAQWLPDVPVLDGRASKAAANHLLAEVYVSIGRVRDESSYYQKAVDAATKVIDDPNYRLMTERFGSEANKPGDVFSDLFRDGNQSRASGNREILWAYQIEFWSTPGGAGGSSGNTWLRAWGPRYYDARDPNNALGFRLTVDSIGRGVGWVRPTNYWVYDIWRNHETDIRNAPTNVRRDWYYNNPSSRYFGQKLEPHAYFKTAEDTMWRVYPMIRKIEGKIMDINSGRTYTDQPVYRLAETYLLRAEAHLLLGQGQLAAESINAVRRRANAAEVTGAEVDIDFILDERARELIIEEPRRRTLTRMGKLVERVRKYGMRQTTVTSIQDYHEWWPIPQGVIDANLDVKIAQNPGYIQ